MAPRNAFARAMGLACALTSSLVAQESKIQPVPSHTPLTLLTSDQPIEKSAAGQHDSAWQSCGRNSQLFFAAEAVWLKRNRPEGTINYDAQRGTQNQSIKDLDFELQPGARLTVGRRLECGNALEISWLGWNDWSSQTPVVTNGNGLRANNAFLVNNFPFTFAAALTQHYSYAARLHNVEINARRPWNDGGMFCTSWLIGARYIRWDERGTLVSFADVIDQGPDYADQRGINDLWGGQVGVDFLFAPLCWFSTSFGSRVGLYGNSATQRFAVTESGTIGTVPTTGTFASSSHTCDLAVSVDLAVTSRLQLTHHLNVFAGWQYTFLNGLALAPKQNIPGQINTNGVLHLTGPFAGMEYNW